MKNQTKIVKNNEKIQTKINFLIKLKGKFVSFERKKKKKKFLMIKIRNRFTKYLNYALYNILATQYSCYTEKNNQIISGYRSIVCFHFLSLNLRNCFSFQSMRSAQIANRLLFFISRVFFFVKV